MAKENKGSSSKAVSRQHAPGTTDPRFARLQNDPRFLRAKRDDAKVVVDDRFKALLGDGRDGAQFGINKRASKVDRFGRKAKVGSKDEEEMKRLYKLERQSKRPEEDGDGGESSNESASEAEEDGKAYVDYARGGADLESSSDEDDEDDDDDEDSSSSSSSDGESDVAIGTSAALRREKRRNATRRDDDDDDDDGESSSSVSGAEDLPADLQATDPRTLAALDAQAIATMKETEDREDAQPGSSRSKSKQNRRRREQDTVPLGEETRRLAIVNMDWDHVRSLDLYKVFSSLVSPVATRLPGTSVAQTDDGNARRHQASVQVKGTVESVRVYVSEFGKERMKREDIEGPPKDIFKSRSAADGGEEPSTRKKRKKTKGKSKVKGSAQEDEDDDDDEDDAVFEVDDGAEFDEEALRKYQLERLRYYYAVATFDSPLSARHVYDEIDGTEMERTANVFDLQFVPDDVEFADHQGDDGWRDEARPGVDDGVAYKGVDWSTAALRHSKVRLTWDAPDPERQKITRRANLTKDQIRDEDFKAYLASDSEPSDEDEDAEAADDGAGAAHRNKMRALLGLDGEDGGGESGSRGKGRPSSSAFQDARGSQGDNAQEEQGDMQITFMPGLSEAAARRANKAVTATGEGEETTLEKYLRKQREKKASRRAAKEGQAEAADGEAEASASSAPVVPKDSDLGFDDPFFASDNDEGEVDFDEMLAAEKKRGKDKGNGGNSSSSKAKAKTEYDRAPPSRDANDDDVASADEDGTHRDHFSMQDVIKAEMKSGKKMNRWEKKKAAKKGGAIGGGTTTTAPKAVQGDFEMNVADPRFNAVMDDHQYAIDPSHPGFVKTSGMQKLLEEKRKRSGTANANGGGGSHGDGGRQAKKAKKNRDADNSDASAMLKSLQARQQQKSGQRGGKKA